MADDFRPEDIIGEAKKKINEFKHVPIAALIFLIIIILKSGIYSIKTEEVGVIQRFGKYLYTSSPGLHVKLPLGIDKLTPVKVKRIFKQEFGLRTLRPGVRTQYSTRRYDEESLMLTGDLNTLDVRWIVQFRVKDPVKLLFSTRDPVDNVRDISEVVMRRLVGDYLVDEVLTTEREEIDHLAQLEIQKILDGYQTGVQIVTVKLQDVNPLWEIQFGRNTANLAEDLKMKLARNRIEFVVKTLPPEGV